MMKFKMYSKQQLCCVGMKILRKVIIAIVLLSMNIQSVHLDYSDLEIKVAESHLNNLNLWFSKEYIFDVARTVVMTSEGDNYFQLNDLQTKFQNYLNNNITLPVVILNTKIFLKLSKKSNSSSGENATMFENIQKTVFLIIFKSIFTLNESVNRTSWAKFYTRYNTQHFLFVIASVEGFEESCDGEGVFAALKEYTGWFFETAWVVYRMIECLILIPSICGRQIILKYDFIDTHSHSVYAEGVTIIEEKHLYHDKTILQHNYKNFNQYPLKINAFPRLPSLVDKEMAPSFSGTYLDEDIATVGHLAGFDGFTMSNLVKTLNFKPVISPPSDSTKYGRLVNGTFTGSLGDIVYKRDDISFNARFIKNYKTDDLEFTAPILSDDFCIITPKAQQIPHWMSIFMIFDSNIWILIACCMLVSGFVWWIMKTKLMDNVDEQKPFYMYYMDICLLFISNPIILPSIYQERLFITMCLIFNLIVAGLFQGQLSTAYSTVSYYSDIKSLEDLDKSGYVIETSNDDIFGLNITKVGDRLSKKIIKGTKALQGVAGETNFAAVERKADAKLMIERNFTNRYGEPLLHIVEDCPRSYHLAYIVYKGFPLLKYINDFLVKCVEAGLINKWYYFTDYSILLPLRFQSEGRDHLERKLTILDVQTSFVILIMGIVLSMIIFLVEIIIHRRANKKNIRRKRFQQIMKAEKNTVVLYMNFSETLEQNKTLKF